MKRNKQGFTLIELSIVLVIIGLIVGGVLVGQDLIQAAKQRAVITDIEKTKTAYNTFKLKYNCIAGDCNRAASLGLGNNGNGNKSLDIAAEQAQFWLQLSNADLIEGTYDGVDDLYKTEFNAEFLVGTGTWAAVLGRPRLAITQATKSGSSYLLGPVITPSIARDFDTKLDDGLPGNGNIIAATGATIGATTMSQAVSDGAPGCVRPVGAWYYNVEASGTDCGLLFTNQAFLKSW